MDAIDWTTSIASVLVAILSGGAGAAWINSRASKQKDDASAYSDLTAAQSILMKDLEDVRNARRKDNSENVEARKRDKLEFDTALEKMQTKYDIALAALQAKYDALDLRFAALEKQRDELLYENWELKKEQGK